MRQRHGSRGSRSFIEDSPKCFQNFSVRLSSAIDKGRRKTGVTHDLMAMHMEQSNAWDEVKVIADFQKFPSFYSSTEIDYILTIDVIDENALGGFFGVCIRQGLREGIINVHLPLSLLKIDHGPWCVTTMAETGNGSDAGAITTFPTLAAVLHSTMFMACARLHLVYEIFWT